ncbi:MAG TPA: hypothetical protein VKA79_09465 [Aestuariivirgaceae bacterium]|nr:hypothetical protein [Aestuariivirgaceae bacterium]
MISSFAATEPLTPPRVGLTSLAAETRQIVDHHQEVHVRSRRKLSLFASGLLVATALVLILLSAATL